MPALSLSLPVESTSTRPNFLRVLWLSLIAVRPCATVAPPFLCPEVRHALSNTSSPTRLVLTRHLHRLVCGTSLPPLSSFGPRLLHCRRRLSQPCCSAPYPEPARRFSATT